MGQMVDLDINIVRLGRWVPSYISQWLKKSAVRLDLHHTYQLVYELMAKLDTEGQSTLCHCSLDHLHLCPIGNPKQVRQVSH